MSNDTQLQVTQILQQAEAGDPKATAQLLPLVYGELRRIAQSQMNGERPDHTLQATALVHEAYLKLVGQESLLRWESRGHFFKAAAEAMRRLLVDHARSRLAKKRGGDLIREELPEIVLSNQLSAEQIVEFDEILERFCDEDPVKGELVKLRCFAGLDREALSNALSISLATVDRYWQYAKLRIYCELTEASDPATRPSAEGVGDHVVSRSGEPSP
jgi:RNA polymerase sigma factor (TIGR02999 family)